MIQRREQFLYLSFVNFLVFKPVYPEQVVIEGSDDLHEGYGLWEFLELVDHFKVESEDSIVIESRIDGKHELVEDKCKAGYILIICEIRHLYGFIRHEEYVD